MMAGVMAAMVTAMCAAVATVGWVLTVAWAVCMVTAAGVVLTVVAGVAVRVAGLR